MTNYDSSGNVSVDFVWGNFPLQPNDGRSDTVISIPQVEDYGWSQARKFVSDTLNPNLGFHSVATTGWSNFPGFIEDYAGDGDTDLEIKVPNLVRKSLAKAQDALDPLEMDLFAVPHNLTISGITTNGTTVRIFAYDTEWNNWGGGYPNSHLIGLKAGDQVALSITGDNEGVINFGSSVTISAVNVDGTDSWFEFVWGSDLGLDEPASGTVYAGPNIVDKVLLQRSQIREIGQQVNVRYMGD